MQGSFTEAWVQHTPHRRPRGREADLDKGPAPWAHHPGDPEPQRPSDGPLGLEHTQLTIYEKEKVDSPALPLFFPPMSYKIKDSGKTWALLFSPHS